MNDGSGFTINVPCKGFPAIPSALELDILSIETTDSQDQAKIRNPIIALDQGPQWDINNPQQNIDKSFFLYLPDDIRIESGFLTEDNTFGDSTTKVLMVIENQSFIPHLSAVNDAPPYLYSLEV